MLNKTVVELIAAAMLIASLSGCIMGDGNDANKNNFGSEKAPFAGGFSNTSVFPGEYDTSSTYSRTLNDGQYEPMGDEIIYLESELDGADIQIGLVRPNVPNGTKIPIVVEAGPYFYPMQTMSIYSNGVSARWIDNLVPHGYAFAIVAVRGSADSGGACEIMGAAEHADLNQAITWLGNQEWCNGNIGMIGKSYDGSTPWEVASMGNPYLKTIVPISGISDLYNLMFRNGTEVRCPVVFGAAYYPYGFGFNNPENGRSPENTIQGIVSPDTLVGFYASIHSTATGERDPLGFWAARNSRPGVEEKYNGSILLVHGLQDWNVDPHVAYPWVNTLEQRGIVVKHMLGQWEHHYPDSGDLAPTSHMRWDWAEIFLHWFDYWLKGNTSVDLGPEAQVEDSSGMWRSENSWPPDDAIQTNFYLNPGGKLSNSSSQETGSKIIITDGLEMQPSLNGIRFETEILQKDLRFAGIPKLDITVTPTAPAGYVNAYIYAIGGNTNDPFGQILGWGQVDLRFADGSEKTNVIIPGQKLKTTIYFEPIDAVVPAGSKLVLGICQSALYDKYFSAVTPPVILEYGGDQTVLKLDVFERGSDDFFEPPGAIPTE